MSSGVAISAGDRHSVLFRPGTVSYTHLDVYKRQVLERVPYGHSGSLANVRFTVPEFTSLCPMTGQPDFAHIVIDYIPRDWLVESKSLKLYLHSFRNHGAFHEDCTLDIGKKLVGLLSPEWLRIGAYCCLLYTSRCV